MEREPKSKGNLNDERNWSTYKRTQVRCKQATPDKVHDLPGFLDFCQGSDDRILRLESPKKDNLYRGPLFGVSEYPGFVFMPQGLAESLQTQLAFEAVTEFCESPYATNIDLVSPKKSEEVNLPDETLWKLWKRENGFVENGQAAPKSGTKKYRTFRKLSWATTGYHYDWSSRSYHEGAKSFMPESLQKLANFFARTSLSISSAENLTFNPSASIVNYYNLKSVMGGHRDDLEYALDKPVVSISLGLPAIFLLGGITKESGPVLPILVRPGDVMILGGDARLNFHGMAKVLPAGFGSVVSGDDNFLPKSDQKITLEMMVEWEPVNAEGGGQSTKSCGMPTEEDQRALLSFLSQHRININVRQVHKGAS